MKYSLWKHHCLYICTSIYTLVSKPRIRSGFLFKNHGYIAYTLKRFVRNNKKILFLNDWCYIEKYQII